MKEALLDKWNRFSRREKFFCVTAGCVLLLYAAYAFVLEGAMQDVLNRKARLAQLHAEYKNMQTGSQRQEELNKELAMLKLELLKKKNEKRELFEGSETRPPAETLLCELRQTVGKIPVQLVEMNVAAGAATGAGAAAAERPNYRVSKISLSYRSGYRDAVNYFLKVIDLSYGISIKTVEMTRGNREDASKRKLNESRIPDGDVPLNTKLGLEIYYR